MLILGCGFALTVGSIAAVSINTVPIRLAGMASATTNLLRDFGFALGPVLIGAVALSKANEWMLEKVGPAIGASGLEPPYSDIAGGIAHEGGAMAINSMPVVPGAGPDMPPSRCRNSSSSSRSSPWAAPTTRPSCSPATVP